MFIARLPKDKQESFLNLAYTMVYADNKLAEEEKKIFQSYQLEVEAGLDKAHKVDFEKELAVFDDCDKVQQNGVFFELYAIALIDGVYAKEEEALINIAKEKFGITDEMMKQMRDGLQALTDAYKQLEKIVKV